MCNNIIYITVHRGYYIYPISLSKLSNNAIVSSANYFLTLRCVEYCDFVKSDAFRIYKSNKSDKFSGKSKYY
jgi:hypothetical protein